MGLPEFHFSSRRPNACIASCRCRFFLRIARSLAILIFALTGCASSEISDGSVVYNQALATAENRLLLLNIVRSSAGHPIYFTQISKLNTSGVADGSSLRLRIPYPSGNPALDGARLIPNLNWQAGIQMDTNPLLGQEFYRGFIRPATPAEIQYFLQYGWSRLLVLTMMVEEIDISPSKLAAINSAVATRAHETCADTSRDAACEAQLGEAALLKECKGNHEPPVIGGRLHFPNRISSRCEFHRIPGLGRKVACLAFPLRAARRKTPTTRKDDGAGTFE